MKNHKKTLSLLMVGRIYQQQAVFELIESAAHRFIQKAAQTSFYFMDQRTRLKMKTRNNFSCQLFDSKSHQSHIDYIITIGGDGTILYGAKQFIQEVPPLLSFQRGSLGFMCRFAINLMTQIIDQLIQYHYRQETEEIPFQKTSLMRLEAIKTSEGAKLSHKVCINEVYISRKAQERICLQIFVNNERLTLTSGDGILISTPTGSTAYSLSAGGPILSNGVNGILIVPIAPNSLSFRPICFPSDSKIRIRLHESSRSTATVSFDGQTTQQFTYNHEVSISRAAHDIVFFQPRSQQRRMPTWIQRLKLFLGWNDHYRAPEEKYQPQINTHMNKRTCADDQ